MVRITNYNCWIGEGTDLKLSSAMLVTSCKVRLTSSYNKDRLWPGFVFRNSLSNMQRVFRQTASLAVPRERESFACALSSGWYDLCLPGFSKPPGYFTTFSFRRQVSPRRSHLVALLLVCWEGVDGNTIFLCFGSIYNFVLNLNTQGFNLGVWSSFIAMSKIS